MNWWIIEMIKIVLNINDIYNYSDECFVENFSEDLFRSFEHRYTYDFDRFIFQIALYVGDSIPEPIELVDAATLVIEKDDETPKLGMYNCSISLKTYTIEPEINFKYNCWAKSYMDEKLIKKCLSVFLQIIWNSIQYHGKHMILRENNPKNKFSEK